MQESHPEETQRRNCQLWKWLAASAIRIQQRGDAAIWQGLVAGRRHLGKCKTALELRSVLGEVPVGVG